MHHHTVYLGLGSNLGNKKSILESAVNEINNRIGTIVARSDFFETQAWGFDTDNTFINAVVCISTVLEPMQILQTTQDIEKELGRTAKSVNGEYHDRTIDIDILLYDDCQINLPQLTIPHPLMHRRRFVLEPLAQIAPTLIIPGVGRSVNELLPQAD